MTRSSVVSALYPNLRWQQKKFANKEALPRSEKINQSFSFLGVKHLLMEIIPAFKVK